MAARIPLGLALGIGGLLFLAAALPALAEHTPEHRYFLVGAVTNENGQPLCGVLVRAAVVGSQGDSDRNRTASTDLSGRYSIQLHMHSGRVERDPEAVPAEIGVSIRVSIDAYGLSRLTNAEINEGNPQGWGQQTIDFQVADVRSPGLCMTEVAAIGGTVVAGVGGAFIVVRRRRHGAGRSAGRGHKALLELPGMNRSRVREIESAGIRSVKDLAEAEPEGLSKSTSLTPKQARLFVKRAQDAVQGKKD